MIAKCSPLRGDSRACLTMRLFLTTRSRNTRSKVRLIARILSAPIIVVGRGIIEVAKEIAVGLEQKPCIGGFKADFIGLHRTIEGEEILILAKGIGEDFVPLSIAFAADLLRLG